MDEVSLSSPPPPSPSSLPHALTQPLPDHYLFPQFLFSPVSSLSPPQVHTLPPRLQAWRRLEGAWGHGDPEAVQRGVPSPLWASVSRGFLISSPLLPEGTPWSVQGAVEGGHVLGRGGNRTHRPVCEGLWVTFLPQSWVSPTQICDFQT